MTPTDFAPHVTTFLSTYLPAQRNLSPHTIKAYRDTFVLLLRYCRDVRKLPPDRLQLDHLDAPLLVAFLQYLETERHCTPSTCNTRLAALHSFFRYLQSEEPGRLLHCQRILAIPLQRHARPPVSYLSREDLTALLAQPNPHTKKGRRDAVLLSLLYDTGARVQEVIDLCVRELRLEPPSHVRLTGKGRKMRLVPLMEPTAQLLREYLREHSLDRPECGDAVLFPNRHGARLSRTGVRYLLQTYVEQAQTTRPSLRQSISPHTLRHTKAMHLLQAGNPLVVIRDILGHSDIKSTEIYARADLAMMRRALEKASDTPARGELPSWQTDKTLMDWLRSL